MRLSKRLGGPGRPGIGFAILVLTAILATGCRPLKFFSRNACEILNCNTLFFIDDLFPLSAPPMEGVPGGAGDQNDGGAPGH